MCSCQITKLLFCVIHSKSKKDWGGFENNALLYYATKNPTNSTNPKIQELFLILPANACLFACCLHDHKSRAVKRKRGMPLKGEKGFARSSFIHSQYHLLIFQLATSLTTAILKFLTFFSFKGSSKQPWIFIIWAQSYNHQQQGCATPSDQLNGFRFQQWNLAGSFP